MPKMHHPGAASVFLYIATASLFIVGAELYSELFGLTMSMSPHAEVPYPSQYVLFLVVSVLVVICFGWFNYRMFNKKKFGISIALSLVSIGWMLLTNVHQNMYALHGGPFVEANACRGITIPLWSEPRQTGPGLLDRGTIAHTICIGTMEIRF